MYRAFLKLNLSSCANIWRLDASVNLLARVHFMSSEYESGQLIFNVLNAQDHILGQEMSVLI